MRPIEPLSDEVMQLLRHEQQLEATSPEMRRRVLARARFAKRVLTAAPSRPRRGPIAYFIAAAGVGVGVLAFAAIRHQTSVPVGPSAGSLGVSPSVHPTAAEPAASSVALWATPPGRAIAEPPPPAGEPTAPSAPESKGKTAREKGAASAETELQLLQRARAALAHGDNSAVFAALEEHARRFPGGKLREEREALRVTALSNAGRHAEARRAAARFTQLFPRSVLSAQMAAKAKSPP